MKKPITDIGDNRVGLAIANQPTSGHTIYGQHRMIEHLIRDSMIEAGYGNKSHENPFLDLIEPGMTVLLKPNWVLHYNQGHHGMDCMVTHPNFILAVLRKVFQAKPKRVILGDAPVQGCVWQMLVPKEFLNFIMDMAKENRILMEIIDFRRTIAPTGNIADGVANKVRPLGNYITFDLGSNSLLEPITIPEGRFRVTCYNPDELRKNHTTGVHKYVLCKEAFESDVIISMPKLKTHKKTGITGALKNLVGLNGNKDFLPHHRVGSPESQGDCYPYKSVVKSLAEEILDEANRHIGSLTHRILSRLAGIVWRLGPKHPQATLEGSWYGNDTCWRMVLDLNRILLYGGKDGSMAETPLRKVYSLCDAIICGEGNGPLSPTPIALGAVTFSNCAAYSEIAHTALMGFDHTKIPLINQSFENFRWPLAQKPHDVTIYCQQEVLTPQEITNRFGIPFKPSDGWSGHIEL